jgi:SNF2 family DNA or RNA helicase
MRFAFAGDVTQVNAALNASVCFTKQERGTLNLDVAWKANIDGKEVDLPEPVAQWQPADGVLHTMDPMRVAELTQGLAALGYQRGKVWNVPLARVANVVDELVRLRCEIWWEKQRFTKEPTLDIRIRSGIEWIDVEVSFGEGEQRIDLPALLRSVQRRASMVRLADGSVARLTTEARLRLELLLRAAKTVDVNLLRFASNEAAMVDELASVDADGGASGTFTRDDGFAELCERARSYTAPPAVAVPADFAATLRPYQLEGLAWLQQLAREQRGGCLADDMGLGKTVQVLAHLLMLHQPRTADLDVAAGRRPASLIIAPVSLLTHWRKEAARFAPSLRTLSWYREENGTLAHVAELADVVVTSHGTVRQHAAEFAARPWLAVVIDEAQAIKNETTHLAAAVRQLTATHRLALSGTPMENRLRDVASLFRFLQPAVAAPGTALHNVCQPIDPDVDPDGILARKAAVTVGRLLAPYMLRRTKREVLTELPSKTELTVEIDLSPDERAFYKSMLEQFIQQGVTRSSFGGMPNPELLAAILRLRQAALHRGLVDSAFMHHSSSKIEFLIERLVELGAAGHRALVFSQFTSLLQIVSARLRAQRISFDYLDGRTRDRGAVVDRFQAPTGAQVFLISLRAGGAGLNLTAADYVFLLDPWWNPAVEAQAIDRVHRIGQQRPVTAYRLVAQDTIETKMQLLQEKKRGLVQGLFGDQAGIGSLTSDDLASLFS